MLWNKIKNNKYLDKKGWLKWDKLMKDDMEDVYQQMTKKSVEPPQGRWPDGENSNYGLVNLTDQPWPALTDMIMNTNPTLYALHNNTLNS